MGDNPSLRGLCPFKKGNGWYSHPLPLLSCKKERTACAVFPSLAVDEIDKLVKLINFKLNYIFWVTPTGVGIFQQCKPC